MKQGQWLNALGVIIGLASFVLEWLTPFWGLVFVFWAIRGVQKQKIVLFTEVVERDYPLLFWLVVLLWMLFGAYLVIYPYIEY